MGMRSTCLIICQAASSEDVLTHITTKVVRFNNTHGNFFISGVYYGKLKSHYHKCYTSSCTVCAMDVNDTVSQIMWLVEEICSVIVLF